MRGEQSAKGVGPQNVPFANGAWFEEGAWSDWDDPLRGRGLKWCDLQMGRGLRRGRGLIGTTR